MVGGAAQAIMPFWKQLSFTERSWRLVQAAEAEHLSSIADRLLAAVVWLRKVTAQPTCKFSLRDMPDPGLMPDIGRAASARSGCD